jgi:hypothetical protein
MKRGHGIKEEISTNFRIALRSRHCTARTGHAEVGGGKTTGIANAILQPAFYEQNRVAVNRG